MAIDLALLHICSHACEHQTRNRHLCWKKINFSYGELKIIFNSRGKYVMKYVGFLISKINMLHYSVGYMIACMWASNAESSSVSSSPLAQSYYIVTSSPTVASVAELSVLARSLLLLHIWYMAYRTLDPRYTWLSNIPIRVLHTELQTLFTTSSCHCHSSMLTTFCN